MNKRDLIIIGSGPAGLTAAIYASRAVLKPLLFEGIQPGGQLTITPDIENFPGFPQAISGPGLMDEMRQQAEKFGTEIVPGEIVRVQFTADKKLLWDEDNNEYEARAVIIATGASARYLGLENETRLRGRGVSACATCDGFFFKDKVVAVIGGGDTAMDEALFLTKFATKIYLIHRRDEFRASKIMLERVRNHPQIELITSATIDDVLGDDRVTGLRLLDKKIDLTRDLPVDGVFLAIGHTPNTKIFAGQIDLDEKGYIKTSPDKACQTATNIPGVFACGDVQDPHYRQAVTSAGTGCMAAKDAEIFIESAKCPVSL